MTFAILLFASMNAAEAKKSKKTDEKDQKTSEKVVVKQAKANVPSDSNSKQFAKMLLSQAYTQFSPDIEGLVYKSIEFKSDNTWTTDAAIVTFEAEMECVESGTWTLDPAESNKVATLNLKLTNTDCPSRESGESIRFKATLRGNQIDAEFR